MLSAEDSLVLVVDIQEKLVKALEKDTIVSKASKIVEGARILDIPVIFTEQYPKGLGNTVEQLTKIKNTDAKTHRCIDALQFNNSNLCEIPQEQLTDNGYSSIPLYLQASYSVIEKTYFNALLEDNFKEKIKSYGRKQIVIMGIETHICVYQTACALVEEGFEVYAIKDACASRNKYEFKQGIEAMRDNGVKISCVEMTLFEWLKGAKHPKFKEIQALIK